METVIDTDLPVYGIIHDLADVFAEQFKYIDTAPPSSRAAYIAATRDCIIGSAIMLHKRFPEYDIALFYKRAGYTGTHPVHT